MRRFVVAAGAASLALAASTANATVFALDSYTVTAHTGNSDGLTVDIQDLLNVSPPLDIDLGSPASKTYDLFKIYTTESTVNAGEDTVPQDISVDFDFSAPTPNSGATVDGTTQGNLILHGLFQNGSVSWSGPADFTWTAPGFTNPGLMTITLSNGTFDTGILGLHGGSKAGYVVTATFDWANDPSGAVPEPASWALMITGFGLTGAALRRRRTMAVAA